MTLKIALIILLVFFQLTAQDGVMQKWERHFTQPDSGNYLYCIDGDDEGNIYLSGTRFQSDPFTHTDFSTIKYNSSGELLWESNYNSQYNGIDEPADLIIDNNGNIYVTGWGTGTEALDEFVTIKYNSSGIEQWISVFNGPGFEGQSFNDHATNMVMDKDGNIYVTGFVQVMDSTYIYTDIATVKYGNNGEELWSTHFSQPEGEDTPKGITVDNDGNVYVIGYKDPIDFEILDDIVILCYDSQGNEKWSKIIDGGINGHDRGIDILTDSEGFIYITGFVNSLITDSNADVITQKYNSEGNLVWSMVVDTDIPYQGNHYDTPLMMKFDDQENLYILASTGTANMSLIKYSKNGTELWITKNDLLTLASLSGSFTIDKVGNVYVTGDGWSEKGEQLATAKFNPEGEKLWEIIYEDELTNELGVFQNFSCGIVLDDSANVYVAGTTQNSGTMMYTLIKYLQTGVTDIEDQRNFSNKFSLAQNYPNPFNPVTKIRYSISRQIGLNEKVQLKIFDITGKDIATIVNAIHSPGEYEVEFDASPYSSGIYFYVLKANYLRIVKKCLLLK